MAATKTHGARIIAIVEEHLGERGILADEQVDIEPSGVSGTLYEVRFTFDGVDADGSARRISMHVQVDSWTRQVENVFEGSYPAGN